MKRSKYVSDILKKIRSNKKEVVLQNSDTDIVCKAFGCDKKLSHIEYLYSDYCFKHQLEIKNKTI